MGKGVWFVKEIESCPRSRSLWSWLSSIWESLVSKGWDLGEGNSTLAPKDPPPHLDSLDLCFSVLEHFLGWWHGNPKTTKNKLSEREIAPKKIWVLYIGQAGTKVGTQQTSRSCLSNLCTVICPFYYTNTVCSSVSGRDSLVAAGRRLAGGNKSQNPVLCWFPHPPLSQWALFQFRSMALNEQRCGWN